MPPKPSKSTNPSASKNTGKTKKPKQPEKPEQPEQSKQSKHVTFPPVDPILERSASMYGDYDRRDNTPISRITREELDELEVPVKRHPYKDNYVEDTELNAYRTMTVEEANRYLGPSDPTMRSDTDAINKQKEERNQKLYRERAIANWWAEQQRLREEQGPTDSLVHRTAISTNVFNHPQGSGPPDYSQFLGLPFMIRNNTGPENSGVDRDNTESGNFGGKRRTKKSRKSRKVRKVRKVRKARKSRKSRKAKGG